MESREPFHQTAESSIVLRSIAPQSLRELHPAMSIRRHPAVFSPGLGNCGGVSANSPLSRSKKIRETSNAWLVTPSRVI